MTHFMRYSVNCSIPFTQPPLLERPVATTQAGLESVESGRPLAEVVPSDADAETFVRAVYEAGGRLTSLNSVAGDRLAADQGILSALGRSAEFRDNIEATLAIGCRLVCRDSNTLHRARVVGVDPKGQEELAAGNLALAARAAEAIDAQVLFEPFSGAEDHPLMTASDAIAVAERVRDRFGPVNIALLADPYHLTVNSEDVDWVVADFCHSVVHMQIADNPGRNEPATIGLPFCGTSRAWMISATRGGSASSTRPKALVHRVSTGLPGARLPGRTHVLRTRPPIWREAVGRLVRPAELDQRGSTLGRSC